MDKDSYKDLRYWENKIKDKLLRRDFERGKIGIGVIYNLLCSVSPILKANKSQDGLLQHKDKRLAFYGAGIKLNEFFEHYKDSISDLNIVGIFDQNKNKQGSCINGIEISAPEKITELKPETIILSVANKTMVLPFVEKLIRENGLNCTIEADF